MTPYEQDIAERLTRIEAAAKRLIDMQAHPFYVADSSARAECACPEKQVLVDPQTVDAAMVARETWCPTHGYQNDCWMCGAQVSTEVCKAHSPKCG